MEGITIGEISIAIALIVGIWKGVDFLAEKITAPQKKMQEQINFTLKICVSLLEHELTGDHINDMEALNKEVKDYLINN